MSQPTGATSLRHRAKGSWWVCLDSQSMPEAPILITGAEGFVGRHLTAHLQACGDEVIGVDRVPGGPYGPVDITDAAAVTALIAEIARSAIYHLAGWADVGGS